MTGAGPTVRRAAALYALAYFGAHVSFMPLFALLLPRRVASISQDEAVQLLSLLLLVGGITASVANIAAGRLSDWWLRRRGNRIAVLVAGSALTIGSLGAIGFIKSQGGLIAAIILFQVSLNVLLAPLSALLADHVEDGRKGQVAGWLNATLPMSSAVTALAGFLFVSDSAAAFVLVAAISAIALLPLLLVAPFATDQGSRTEPMQLNGGHDRQRQADYVRIWLARLLVQIGAAFTINFAFLYLVSESDVERASQSLATISVMVAIGSVLSAVIAGHWSDRQGSRIKPMLGAISACIIGLALLAANSSLMLTFVGFTLFHIGLTAFLSVDFATVSQLVSASPRRAELLGFMNLTNTLPAIIVPIGLLSIAGNEQSLPWSLCFAAAAGLAMVAGLLISRLKSLR